MGTSKSNGMPLFAGLQLIVGGKAVETESEISLAMMPRIIGRIPSDTAFEGAELEFDADDCYTSVPPIRPNLLQYTFKEDGRSDSSSGMTPKKFVTPSSFYNRPQQTNAPKAL